VKRILFWLIVGIGLIVALLLRHYGANNLDVAPDVRQQIDKTKRCQ
jgi:hypothetical protein